MAVEDKGARIPYDCDGSQKDFAFGFSVYDKADLKVYHRYTENGEVKEPLLVEGVDYTLSSAYSHYRKGGVVSATEAYPSPDKIVLLNDPELKQTADYEHGDPLPSQEHENNMDRAYIALQKQRDTINLALKLMTTSSFKNLTLPDPVANMLLSWKEDLSGLKNIDFKAPSGSFTLTPFAETIFDDENAAAVLTTLGFSAFIQTLINDVDAATARATLDVPEDVSTTQGDLLLRGASAVERLAAGALDTYLKGQGAGSKPIYEKLALKDTGIKIGNQTRSTAGDQVITGVGFQPSLVIFLAGDSTASNINICIGVDNGTVHHAVQIDTDATRQIINISESINIFRGVGNVLGGSITAIGADGFTITWTLTGTCSAGFIYCCLP